MINVGVIGMGMMGSTHLDAYAKRDDVRIVALADTNPQRLTGQEAAAGNIRGQTQGGVDLIQATRYAEGLELIADEDVQLVDICLPTPMHLDYAVAALESGKHVLVEKPVCRTFADAQKLARMAAKSEGLSMGAMCMRFWPGWSWLKQVIDRQTYGKVLAACFRRLSPHPGGSFYSDGEACGGALLDLHIHDTDFIHYCFGVPTAVYSRGYTRITGRIDHVITHYHYDDIPLVYAEGGWAMSDGFDFQMQYTVNFERATAEFSFDGNSHVRLSEHGCVPREIELEGGMGYEHEIAYFIDCVHRNEPAKTVTLDHAAESVRIVEAEATSIERGLLIKL